jgi:hypothetical protein
MFAVSLIEAGTPHARKWRASSQEIGTDNARKQNENTRAMNEAKCSKNNSTMFLPLYTNFRDNTKLHDKQSWGVVSREVKSLSETIDFKG